MKNIDCPNDHELYVLTDKQMDALTEENPELLAIDIPRGIGREYWLCTNCGRITVVDEETGIVLFRYAKEE